MSTGVRRPPVLVILLLALILWQAYENLTNVTGTWGTVPGSSLLVSLQVLVAALVIPLTPLLWTRDRRAAAAIRVYAALLVAEATTAATIFSAGNERLTAGLGTFGGSVLVMLAISHFTVRWIRRGQPVPENANAGHPA